MKLRRGTRRHSGEQHSRSIPVKHPTSTDDQRPDAASACSKSSFSRTHACVPLKTCQQERNHQLCLQENCDETQPEKSCREKQEKDSFSSRRKTEIGCLVRDCIIQKLNSATSIGLKSHCGETDWVATVGHPAALLRFVTMFISLDFNLQTQESASLPRSAKSTNSKIPECLMFRPTTGRSLSPELKRSAAQLLPHQLDDFTGA